MSLQSDEITREFRRNLVNGEPAWVRLLLDSGADVHGDPKEPRTPLMVAASCGRLEIMRLLLERGADVNARGAEGNTPLMAAASHGHTEAARLLLDAGAEVNARGVNDWTPLMHTWGAVDPLGVAWLLIQAGADVNARSTDGSTAMSLTAYRNDPDPLWELLLKAGAEPLPLVQGLDEALDWAAQDRAEAIEGIRLGLEAGEAGRVRPAAEVFAEMRERLGQPRQ